MSEQDQARMFDAPVPGESLTQDPDNPQPYETAPEYTAVEDFMDDLINNITDEDNIDGVLDPIRKGIPIEDVTQMLLTKAMHSGKINTDLMLTAVEPTLYLLMGLSEYAGIEDPVLYPEDDMLDDEEDEMRALEEAGGSDTKSFEEIPRPKGVSKSLLKKLEGVKDGD